MNEWLISIPDGVVPEDARRIGHVLLAQMLQADRHRLRQLNVAPFAQRRRDDARVDDARHVAAGCGTGAGDR